MIELLYEEEAESSPSSAGGAESYKNGQSQTKRARDISLSVEISNARENLYRIVLCVELLAQRVRIVVKSE